MANKIPFAEANQQTALMNDLTRVVDQLSSMCRTAPLLQEARYAHARAEIDNAIVCLIKAQDVIGLTPRVKD